ncbi:aldose 1-epimerase family protein [Subtercola boreus]|uniref:Aldose epimerase n=1 Tax=Subtercola boreus TaxID=120213 RepID=A0A3E0WBE2_9MICO|nr:aldose 1-epimerase family protein [Subtercola boreus]RFA19366.1 aldose epimerase [Subtercola boreus]RFA19627.1 aldose epimerase [Subtercola boreus]RFA25993.1 aldose epimerase [Subtercola boreus]
MKPLTGEQFAISFDNPGGRGRSTAVVTELAAALRELFLDGVESVEPHSENELPPMGAGLVLVPWPNRIANARWHLDGKAQQLDRTEPSTGNATHGLLRNTAYRVTAQRESAVTLSATVFPQHGYPFRLDTSVQYVLDESGLTVIHTLTNESDAAAPVAVGAHPYFRVGDVPVEDLVVTVDASTVFEVDALNIPTAEVGVEGTEHDLRGGRRVGDLTANSGYGELGFSAGEVVHSVQAPDGSRTELWGDENFAFVQVYTPKDFPRASGPGVAVALEPMTAPADAFNSGRGLRWLAPGETWVLRWGIRHRA